MLYLKNTNRRLFARMRICRHSRAAYITRVTTQRIANIYRRTLNIYVGSIYTYVNICCEIAPGIQNVFTLV